MYIGELIWLIRIVNKLHQKHGVSKTEVWEIFLDKPYFHFVEKGHVKGEDLYYAMGQTAAGRYLVVFFVYKQGSAALVISARAMTKTERKFYEKQ